MTTMTLPKINPITTAAWQKLQALANDEVLNIKDLFAQNPQRFEDFSVESSHFLFDFSKNLINHDILAQLLQLAKQTGLAQGIDMLFGGEKINETENRAVLHTALRDFGPHPIFVDGHNIKPDIQRVQAQMKIFVEALLSGQHKGFTGEKISHVVNLGIGGSDLGPAMLAESLKYYHQGIEVRFVSNIDGSHLLEALRDLDPETTLFIIASKTFTTMETMTNAFSAKAWFLQKATQADVAKHFVALSTNLEAVQNFGILPEYTFEFWDWVGGRFSVWSAIGLSLAIAIGYEAYEELLYGAYEIDVHFKNTPFEKNVPVLMALLGIWYRNFLNYDTHAVLPYSQYLAKFDSYLQQTDMESNGKSCDRNGKKLDYAAGPIIWGDPGSNGQHAFFQLLHQGQSGISKDFIAFSKACEPLGDHHDKLMANCFAQSQAMAFGKTAAEALADMQAQGLPEDQIKTLLPYKIFDGNRPSNTLLFKDLSPKTMGQMLALYEHKVFVQGLIWNIYSFDQWGVELGKVLSSKLLNQIKTKKSPEGNDDSTNALIDYYLKQIEQ
jgi:glucose-6-phosphate isomerase